MTPTENIDERLYLANPVREQMEVPPVETLIAQLDTSIRPLDSLLPENRRRSIRRRPAWRPVLAGSAAATCGLLALALTVQSGGVNVAAAVERAITPGPGVLHMVTESVATTAGEPTKTDRSETWVGANPRRMHTHDVLHTGGETVEGESAIVSVSPPRTLSWVSGTDTIRESTEPVPDHEQTPVAWLREAYADGRVKFAGATEFEGQQAWRLTVERSPGEASSMLEGHEVPLPAVIVSAKTFVPLQSVVYSVITEAGQQRLQTDTTRYLAYEELPLNTSTEGLFSLASHPGTRTVNERAPSEN
jgi:hypothetical protein